jgi:hypothetical protein
MLFLTVVVSCKRETKAVKSIEKQVVANNILKQQEKDSILYFENALIYEFKQNGEKSELWFYVNEKKNQILYVPNDDMIQAVVSHPNGDYLIFGTQENGKKTVIKQNISAVVTNEIDEKVLKSNKETILISQKNMQQKDILCNGFVMKYLQMKGSETLFATNQISINAYQIYGFSRLDGDAKLNFSLDYLNVFKKTQLISHIERTDLKLKLLNYGPNPYEFIVNEYK